MTTNVATKVPWSNNWNRTYKISIGTRAVDANYTSSYTTEETIAQYPTLASSQILLASKDIPKTYNEAIPSDAITLSNLDNPRGFTFKFETQQVASSKGADSERSYLTLSNLSEEVIRILELDNCVVIVEAGYEGNTTLCYTGDVVAVTTQKNLPDISYKIQLTASGVAVRDTMINTHYSEDMPTSDIIVDMAKRFPSTSLATFGLNEYTTQYKTGGTGVTGDLITKWDSYLRSKGLEYTFSNNKIFIIPYRLKGLDYDQFARTNFNLSLDSIKDIQISPDKSKKPTTDLQNKVRKLQINTFYLPIEISQFITIPSSDYTNDFAGTYIVKGRRIILESKGNAWDVVLDVESVTK